MAAYIPKQGDIIAITFDPQSGHEQKGSQPSYPAERFKGPKIYHQGRGNAEGDDVRQGIVFHAELAGGAGHPGNFAVQVVEHTRNDNGNGRR